jgi:hypothetical protein
MRQLSALVGFLMLGSSAAAASPEFAHRVSLQGGAQLGASNHPDGGGTAGGFHVEAELQVWWLIVGGVARADSYPTTNGGVQIGATSTAAHFGVAAPLYRYRDGDRVRELRARGAFELGRHHYTVDGEDEPLFNILGPEVTYESPGHSISFRGQRAGLSLSAIDIGHSSTGVVLALEVVRRTDRHPVDLPYLRTSCGGLFTSGCSSTSGMATAGGQEVTLVVSIGVVIGE